MEIQKKQLIGYTLRELSELQDNWHQLCFVNPTWLQISENPKKFSDTAIHEWQSKYTEF